MSCVSTVFDPGTEREDHRPVFATMTAELSAGRGRARIRREKFDVRRLLTPQGKATFTAELEKFRHPAWSCHPDLHYQQIQEHVLRIMRSHFPLPVNGPRATFIEPGTWALRDRKQALKHRTRQRRDLWRDLLHRALLQWREGADFSVEDLLVKQGLLYQLTAAAIVVATRQIKADILASKSNFLKDLAGSPGQPPGALLRQAKAAGIGGSKTRPVARPLPLICTCRMVQLQPHAGTGTPYGLGTLLSRSSGGRSTPPTTWHSRAALLSRMPTSAGHGPTGTTQKVCWVRQHLR